MQIDATRSLVARNVRFLAKQRGLSLNALADFAGVSRSQLYVLLQGRTGVSLTLLVEVAASLGVEPWELLHPDTSPPLPRRPSASSIHRAKRKRA